MDTVGNMLNSLNNARLTKKKRAAAPHSKLSKSIAAFLQHKGMLAKIREQEGIPRLLIMTLAYNGDQPRLSGIRRLSKPGQRRYVPSGEIPYSSDGLGIIVVSTSAGLKDDKTARKERLGGELICEIW